MCAHIVTKQHGELDMDYQSVMKISNEMNETNDCAVRACTIASGVDYKEVHELFRLQGRANRKGSNQEWTTQVMEQLGFKLEDVTRAVFRQCGKTVKTVSRNLAGGPYLIRVRRHILCLTNGVVQDWTDGRQHRVIEVLRVVNTNAQVALEVPVQRPTARVLVPVAPTLIPFRVGRNVKSQIHGLANEMWKAAGAPTDVKVLRKLRKVMMDVMEQQGIKRTTASTELGQWQKTIL